MNQDEQIYLDVFGAEVVLTAAVRDLIMQKHPESREFIDQIGAVLREPDEIRRSTRQVHSILYYQFAPRVLNGKWLVVVVKQIDRNFVSTLYATDQIKSGEVIWTKRR